jgi:hypothetical protein
VQHRLEPGGHALIFHHIRTIPAVPTLFIRFFHSFTAVDDMTVETQKKGQDLAGSSSQLIGSG